MAAIPVVWGIYWQLSHDKEPSPPAVTASPSINTIAGDGPPGRYQIEMFIQNNSDRPIRGCTVWQQYLQRDLRPIAPPYAVYPSQRPALSLEPGESQTVGAPYGFYFKEQDWFLRHLPVRPGKPRRWLRLEVWLECETPTLATDSSFFDVIAGSPETEVVPQFRLKRPEPLERARRVVPLERPFEDEGLEPGSCRPKQDDCDAGLMPDAPPLGING